MKRLAGSVSVVPSKRIFLSIIADYDLNRSICELIDNALDLWIKEKRTRILKVNIDLDQAQQTIRVSDNAGGLMRDELNLIVGPGQTGNFDEDETIGIFGVGSKRAVVALAQDIKITTRFSAEKTYQIEFDDDWLQDYDWELSVYEVDAIPERTTIIELQKLRANLTDDALQQLRDHLRATYAKFIQDKNLEIRLNSDLLTSLFFEHWAFPPGHEPRRCCDTIETDEGQVEYEIIAGLSKESSPAGEYGVYFYCNDRLVIKALKTYEVGFSTGVAGQPHPSISLLHVSVSLHGKSRLMPWNSSKSDISPKHKIFIALRGILLDFVKHYASLSRRWQGQWPDKVFRHTSGEIITIASPDKLETGRLYLPRLPQARPRYAEIVKQANKDLAIQKPWTKGLYEGIVAVDLIFKQNLEQKNRICLILLDSTLEIAFKDYLANEAVERYGESRLYNLCQNRHSVETEIRKHVELDASLWQKLNYFYRLRCKLVHERASAGITDEQIEEYRDIVQKVLGKLFKLRFDKQPSI